VGKYALKTEIEEIISSPVSWLDGSGQDADIILSCRIRLARNLSSIPFPNRASREDLLRIRELIREAQAQSPSLEDSFYLEMETLSRLDKQMLAERRLISPVFAESKRPSAAIISRDEKISIMINEEDHLRIQSLQSGLNMEAAWEAIRNVDEELGRVLNYAFSDRFGYLTACPTNTGTGMRVSIFIHLPALRMTRELEKILSGNTPTGITVRGFYGEGSDVLGNIFQLSNQLTLGWTERRIMEDLNRVAREVLGREQEAREKLLREDRIQIEDRVFRACGILSQARILNSVEFINLLSALILGVDLGLLKGIDRKVLNELMVITQPAHIQKIHGRRLSPKQRDILRAELVRKRLGLERVFS